jgi:hypothetical protein
VKKDWKKDRAKAAKHARLISRKPELREALYGRAPASNDKADPRETAHERRANDDG